MTSAHQETLTLRGTCLLCCIETGISIALTLACMRGKTLNVVFPSNYSAHQVLTPSTHTRYSASTEPGYIKTLNIVFPSHYSQQVLTPGTQQVLTQVAQEVESFSPHGRPSLPSPPLSRLILSVHITVHLSVHIIVHLAVHMIV